MNLRRAMHALSGFLCGLLFSGACHAELTVSVTRLLALTAERLAIADQVAQSKWNSKAAIEDLPRERQVVNDGVTVAGKQGVAPALARQFLAAQIEASKAVQWRRHREWTLAKAAPFEHPADLLTDIRPHLDALTPKLIAALAEAAPVLANTDLRELAATVPQGADAFAWKVAIAPLLEHAHAVAGESRLDTVQRTGLLRVCMTGDYKPFSIWRSEAFAFEGVDVEIARQLAASLKVEAQFVSTTWAGLMNDFLSNRCDLVSGGVSITLDRARQAFFSLPVMSGGKTPIVRCADVQRYQTLEQIDQPNVRLVVNPGGTNERFARAQFKRLALTVYPDNVGIFEQILQNKADVMVTDAVETLLQQKLHPGLCSVHPDTPFTVEEKAYLLPRADSVFKEYVDQFLHLALINGSYRKLLDDWLK